MPELIPTWCKPHLLSTRKGGLNQVGKNFKQASWVLSPMAVPTYLPIFRTPSSHPTHPTSYLPLLIPHCGIFLTAAAPLLPAQQWHRCPCRHTWAHVMSKCSTLAPDAQALSISGDGGCSMGKWRIAMKLTEPWAHGLTLIWASGRFPHLFSFHSNQ